MKGEQENLLMIFTRNPELGKCKTRLAASVGDRTALEIYKFLLGHTALIAKNANACKAVYYSEKVEEGDLWDDEVFKKEVQEGQDLGHRMANAFKQGFIQGYKRIVIIGSDIFDLTTKDLNTAFEKLRDCDFVMGPAQDGGYYLLGMTCFEPSLFIGKEWGSDSVLGETLADLSGRDYFLLPRRNDVDVLEDIIDNPVFRPFLKDKK